MQLPKQLQNGIDEIISSCGLAELTQAREELSHRYRHSSSKNLSFNRPFMHTELQRQSYVISRMPATFAAIKMALKAIQERGEIHIKSLLDLGAGPGTGMWAACDEFHEIEKAIHIEKDPDLIKMGKKLSLFSDNNAIQSSQWIEDNLETISELPFSDLVLLSYSIGELNPDKIDSLINSCWKSANQLLLIIEPGTPAGFERIRKIRSQLIEIGANLIAPCPHHLRCPMSDGDWCHFAARVERSSLHRQLKGGSLGYEDEKFSYVAATKHPYALPASRILSEPSRHSGHLSLKLCTSEGVKFPTLSKKMGEVYKKGRKAEWGDSWF